MWGLLQLASLEKFPGTPGRRAYDCVLAAFQNSCLKWRLWIFFLSNSAELFQKTSTNNFSPANWLIALKRGDHKGPYSTEKKHRKIHRPFFQGSIHLHRQKCHPSGPPVQFRGFLLSLLDFWLSSHLLSSLHLQYCCRFRQELFRHLLGFDAERRFFYLMKLVTEFLRL